MQDLISAVCSTSNCIRDCICLDRFRHPMAKQPPENFATGMWPSDALANLNQIKGALNAGKNLHKKSESPDPSAQERQPLLKGCRG